MATLYITIAEDCESPFADAHEKLAISGTDAVSTVETPAGSGNGNNLSEIVLYTDTACIVSIGVNPATTDPGAFYVVPNVAKEVDHVPPGMKVAVATA